MVDYNIVVHAAVDLQYPLAYNFNFWNNSGQGVYVDISGVLGALSIATNPGTGYDKTLGQCDLYTYAGIVPDSDLDSINSPPPYMSHSYYYGGNIYMAPNTTVAFQSVSWRNSKDDQWLLGTDVPMIQDPLDPTAPALPVNFGGYQGANIFGGATQELNPQSSGGVWVVTSDKSISATVNFGAALTVDMGGAGGPTNSTNICFQVYNYGAVTAGTKASETFNGADATEKIMARAGDDIVNAGGGADSVEAGQGNDTVDAGPGADIVVGQVGNDLLLGGTGDDWLDGGAGDDTLHGDDGNDSLYGRAGNDQLDGGIGDDRLDGGGGGDTLSGGDGNDTLHGGMGRDSIDGGAGSDMCVWMLATEGHDTIGGFQHGEDMLAFSASGLGGGLADGVALTAAQFQSGPGAAAPASADIRFIYNTNTGVLRYDPDGNGAEVSKIIATLAGAPTLTVDDFVIIA